jgi:hypothetical protein
MIERGKQAASKFDRNQSSSCPKVRKNERRKKPMAKVV